MKTISSIVITLLLIITSSQTVMAKNAHTKSTIQQVSSINLNTADAKSIAKALKGIGIKKAQAIIAYRKKHGNFKAVEELASVKGIGVATIAKNHKLISLH